MADPRAGVGKLQNGLRTESEEMLKQWYNVKRVYAQLARAQVGQTWRDFYMKTNMLLFLFFNWRKIALQCNDVTINENNNRLFNNPLNKIGIHEPVPT